MFCTNLSLIISIPNLFTNILITSLIQTDLIVILHIKKHVCSTIQMSCVYLYFNLLCLKQFRKINIYFYYNEQKSKYS